MRHVNTDYIANGALRDKAVTKPLGLRGPRFLKCQIYPSPFSFNLKQNEDKFVKEHSSSSFVPSSPINPKFSHLSFSYTHLSLALRNGNHNFINILVPEELQTA